MTTTSTRPDAAPGATRPLTKLDHYRLLGDSGLRVSPLCLGTMTFGEDWGWGAGEHTSREMFDAYLEAGGNFLDTADVYTDGTSEQYVGRFAQDVGRDRLVLATKYTNNNPALAKGDPNASGNHRKRMMTALERSLDRLQTDYVDLFWLHIWDFTTPTDELMRAFDDLVRQGKVLYIAISDTPAWKIAELNTYARAHALTRFVCTQVEYSLAQRDVEREILPMCRELGVGLLPWSPLAGGVLTGKYTSQDLQRERELLASGEVDPFDSEQRMVGLTEQKIAIGQTVKRIADAIDRTPAQVALNWLLTRDGVTSVILGARKVSQLQDNLACLEFTLDDEHLTQLNDVSAISYGFPHDFLATSLVRGLSSGGTTRQYLSRSIAGA